MYWHNKLIRYLATALGKIIVGISRHGNMHFSELVKHMPNQFRKASQALQSIVLSWLSTMWILSLYTYYSPVQLGWTSGGQMHMITITWDPLL